MTALAMTPAPAAGLGPQLEAGLKALPFSVAARQSEQLLAYLDLLQKWNRTYNLTAIRDPADMISHHLLDSLAVLPIVQESALARRRQGADAAFHLVDVGSGAGLPGLVLAIMQSDWQIASIDAVDKKAAFQRQAIIELGLRNVTVISGRVEDQAPEVADAVISRAFADLADFVTLAGPLLKPGGAMLAMKGVVPHEEIARLPAPWRVREIRRIQVPGLDVQRHVIVLTKE